MHAPMRKSVTFASQGHLVGQSSDIRKLELAHQQATGKTGIIEKIRGIFSRTTTVDSSASLNLGEANNNNSNNSNNNNNHSNQKKTTLKGHKGLFTRLVPSSLSVSCNALAKSGQSTGNSLDRVPSEPEILTIGKYIKPPETKVNFNLPINRRPSNAFQPPSLRERTKCSPRFPHRVVPTCSLSALEESSDDKSLSVSPKDPPRISLNQSYTNGKWKSMDSPNCPGTNFNFETLR
ncbi:GPRGBB3.2 family protein [Megaselia abdita]